MFFYFNAPETEVIKVCVRRIRRVEVVSRFTRMPDNERGKGCVMPRDIKHVGRHGDGLENALFHLQRFLRGTSRSGSDGKLSGLPDGVFHDLVYRLDLLVPYYLFD